MRTGTAHKISETTNDIADIRGQEEVRKYFVSVANNTEDAKTSNIEFPTTTTVSHLDKDEKAMYEGLRGNMTKMLRDILQTSGFDNEKDSLVRYTLLARAVETVVKQQYVDAKTQSYREGWSLK